MYDFLKTKRVKVKIFFFTLSPPLSFLSLFIQPPFLCVYILFSVSLSLLNTPLVCVAPSSETSKSHPLCHACYVAFITNALLFSFIYITLWSSAVFDLSSGCSSLLGQTSTTIKRKYLSVLSSLIFYLFIFCLSLLLLLLLFRRSYQRYRHGPHENLPPPQSRRSPA